MIALRNLPSKATATGGGLERALKGHGMSLAITKALCKKGPLRAENGETNHGYGW